MTRELTSPTIARIRAPALPNASAQATEDRRRLRGDVVAADDPFEHGPAWDLTGALATRRGFGAAGAQEWIATVPIVVPTGSRTLTLPRSGSWPRDSGPLSCAA